jgi:hypothetical protein
MPALEEVKLLDIARRVAAIINEVASTHDAWFQYLPVKEINSQRERTTEGFLLRWNNGALGPVEILTPAGTHRFNNASNASLHALFDLLKERLGLDEYKNLPHGDRLYAIRMLDGQTLPDPKMD